MRQHPIRCSLLRTALLTLTATLAFCATQAANASAHHRACHQTACPSSIDTTAPSVGWTNPAASATVSGLLWEAANSGPSGRCEVAASDDRGVSKVIFYVDLTALTTEYIAPYNCKFDTTTVSDGSHTLKAVAYDAAGNTSTAQRVVTVSITVTETPPSPSSPAAPFGDAAGLKSWTMAFQDEFDGTSLNTAKWDATWLTGESGYSLPMNEYMNNCFHSSQATVANGSLRLASSPNSNTSCRKKDGSVAPYVTGVVTSHRRSSDPSTKGYATAYGYFEARMNLPVRNGGIVNFPAWWTNGAGLNWPELGEIDIMEELGKGTPCWHYHYQDGSGAHQGPGGCISTIGGQTVDWSGWHTYAARWEPGKITFYFDGRQVASWTSGVVSAEHFLILNHSMDGTPYTNTTMDVDYVRVWK
jgi:beta-glucanase (GH16 family)